MRNGDRMSELFCGFLDALRVCVILTMVSLNFGVFPAPGLENITHATRYPCNYKTGAAVACPASCIGILGTCTVTLPAPASGLTVGPCARGWGMCGPGSFPCPGTITVAPNPANLGKGCNCTITGVW